MATALERHAWVGAPARPPFSHEDWANYQDKIVPYWPQALRQEVSVKDTMETWRPTAARIRWRHDQS